MNSVSTGIAGVGRVDPGTHICAFYSGQKERDGLMMPFIREGLRTGEHCLCYLNDAEPDPYRTLADGTAESPSSQARLDVHHSSEAYLQQGRFSVDHMISALSDKLTPAQEGEFPLLRAAGEMPPPRITPEAGQPEAFFRYESAIDELLEQQPALFLCLYDLDRFGLAMLVAVLKTHPTVLVDRSVFVNPNFVTPADYLSDAEAAPGPVDVDDPLRSDNGDPEETRPWSSLTAHEVRISHFVATGMTNRAIASRLGLSRHTVDAHLKHIYAKLDIHSRVELTVLALQGGTAW